MWIFCFCLNRRKLWLNILHKQLQLIHYLSFYLYIWIWFCAGLASSWANKTLWSIKSKCIIMVCGIFRKYIVFSEMWSFHKNLTMYIAPSPRSLTTQLGFHYVLFWYILRLVSVLHTNYYEGWNAKDRITLLFQP